MESSSSELYPLLPYKYNGYSQENREQEVESEDYETLAEKTCAEEIISSLGMLFSFPCNFFSSFLTVPPKRQVIVSYWGRPHALFRNLEHISLTVLGERFMLFLPTFVKV